MVEIFRMYVEKSHTAKSRLRLPENSEIGELPDNQAFWVSDNQNTWKCHIKSSNGRHHLVAEPWNAFKSRVEGRTISLHKERDGQGAPSYKLI
ncbi:hypothetical protein SLE2022_040310 [Rubroshorea leprosula]